MNQRKSGAVLSYLNIIAKNLVYFLYTPFLLKYVGQADYGLFQMTNSVMMGLSLLSMGFSSAYVRFYTIYEVKNEVNRIKQLNGLYMIIFSFISVVALILGVVLVIKTDVIFGSTLDSRELKLTKYLMLVMILNIALTFISSVFDSNITVNERFVFQQSRQLMQTFLVPVICIPLVFMGVGVLSIEVTQILVTTIFLFLNIRYCLIDLNMRFSFQNIPFNLLKELIIFSFFIFLNQVVDLVNNNVPNFLLGITQGAKMVATFSIAIQIKNMFFMLSTSMSSVFVPKINSLVSSGESKSVLTDLMIRVGRIQMSLLFFVLGGFITVGKFFVSAWVGNQNIMSYYLIILMVLPSIVPLSQNIGVEIQRAMNMHIFRSVVYIIFAVINIVATYWGAIYFGLIGASSGYVISVVFANGILMNWYYYRKINLDMRKYWLETLKVVFPFIVSTIVILLLQVYVAINNVWLFILFGLLYVFLYIIIFFKYTANKYEKNILLSMLKR